jgi:hypothetical protein
VATRREKRGQMAVDDGQDDQARYVHPYIRRLEEGTAREERAFFLCVDGKCNSIIMNLMYLLCI